MWGFPWVSKKYEKELKIGNDLVRFSIRVWVTVNMFPVSADGFLIFLFGEDQVLFEPASIWQLKEIRSLVDQPGSTIGTVAINQCCWGAPYRKPTRLLSTSLQVLSWGSSTWPSFDEQGFYQGPLQKNCGCHISRSLARTAADEAFRTTGTDMYPPALDEGIADAIMHRFLQQSFAPPKVGEEEVQKDKVVAGVVKRDPPDGRRKLDKELAAEVSRETTSGDEDSKKGPKSTAVVTGEVTAGAWQASGDGLGRHEGLPIRCYYKGKLRTTHDGGGLCSPGRWPVKARKELDCPKGIRVASCCKQLFLRWLSSGRS